MDDAEPLHRLYGDRDTMSWWDTPALPDSSATLEMVERQIATMSRGLCAYWTARWQDDDTVIGAFDLSEIAPPSAEVGFIVAPNVWRRGVASEAMLAVMAYGSAALGLTHFTARYHAGNAASAALLRALGFGEPTLLPAAVVRAGETRDCLVCERRD